MPERSSRSKLQENIVALGTLTGANHRSFVVMSSLPPLVSLPEHASFRPTPTRPRRLVTRLPRAKNLEADRARRAAQARRRKRFQQTRLLTLAALAPVGALSLWLGVRAVAYQPQWPTTGSTWTTGLVCEQFPVALGQNWYFASTNGSVWGWSNQDGAPRKVWTGAFPASPRLTGDRTALFVTGHDGTLSCLNPKGQLVWRVKNAGAISSRPAVFRNGEMSALIGGDDTGRLWARDARSGKALWQRHVGAPIGEGTTATPWGVVLPFLGSSDSRGGLRCFSPKDGKPLWSFPANPRVHGAGTALARFDANTNRLFWCNDDGAVFALDARTGRKIWKAFVAPRPGAKNAVVLRASPVFADGVLVVGGNDGGLRAFDAGTGRALWTRQLGQTLDAPLGKTRLDGRVVVTAGDSPVVLVDAHNGTLAGTLGQGQMSWNGSQFVAADEAGVWHRWTSF